MEISPQHLLSLLTKGIDETEIIARLAKYYPKIFVHLIMMDELEEKCQEAFSSGDSLGGKKVAAIKTYRTLTGTDLRTAKEAIEEWINSGVLVPANDHGDYHADE